MVSGRSCRALVLAIVVLLTGASGANAASGGNAPGNSRNLHGRDAAFVSALEADGFVVREGKLEIVDLQAAVNDQYMDSCAGNNAGQYYKTLSVPPPPGQNITLDVGFKLAEDEAVVYVGKTPPMADYFSFCLFLWSRHYPDSCALSGDWLFASVSDPLNCSLIRTEGQDNTFQKNTLVVITADEGVYERIKSAAGSAGFPGSMVNVMVLPSSVLSLGTKVSSDRVSAVVRTANFVSDAQARKYLADEKWARVFRVTPLVAPEPRPYAQPAWRNRAWRHEEEFVPGLQAGLERLRKAILAKTPRVQDRQLDSIRWWYDSKDVLLDDPSSPAYRQFVAGESSDTPYTRSSEDGQPTNFVLGADDMVVVYGVNHAATGLATYSSFGVYGDYTLSHCPRKPDDPWFVFTAGVPIWNGVVGMTSHGFPGSAEMYIPGDPMARYLYAVRVVRKGRAVARDPYCVVVPAIEDSKLGEPFYADVIPLDKPALIGYRAYLNPATGSGPAYENMIFDRAIWFKLK